MLRKEDCKIARKIESDIDELQRHEKRHNEIGCVVVHGPRHRTGFRGVKFRLKGINPSKKSTVSLFR
jgi:hypothetical protein